MFPPSEVVRRDSTLLASQPALVSRPGGSFPRWIPSRECLSGKLSRSLCVRAVLNSARFHQGMDTLFRVHRACRVHVEKPDLADNRGANEFVVVIYLRANFQAASARNAARKRIGLLLRLGRHARPCAEVVGPVDGNPALNALETFEHELPVNGEVPNHRKL